MRLLANFLASLLLGFWIVAIAIFSVQNFEPFISVKFFVWSSISLPVGVLLAGCAAAGALFGSLLPLLWTGGRSSRRRDDWVD